MRVGQTIFFAGLFLCCSFLSRAQVRIFAGPQLSTAAYSIRNAKQETKWKTGFAAGVGLTKAVEGPLYFSPSIYFNREGYKVTFDRPGVPPDSATKNNNTTISTLVFAPLFQLNFSKKKNHFFIRFGPAFETALSGKETFDSAANKSVSRSMLFDPTGYSRTNVFAEFHLGFESKGLGFFFRYQHGLSSLNNSDRGPVILNRVVGAMLQWKF